jgi:hypothetical protein
MGAYGRLWAAVGVPWLVELGQPLPRPSEHALKVGHGGHADTEAEDEEEDALHFRAPVLTVRGRQALGG